ncbi:MAG: hypothetical protein ACM335_09445, partial [Deltaproteobacteria bacterium]
MEDRAVYPFVPRKIEGRKRAHQTKVGQEVPQLQERAARPNPTSSTTYEAQVRLFEKIEAERDTIARVMLRYPKLTDAIMPPLTDRERRTLFTKTAEWAMAVEDLLATQCATLDSESSFDTWSVASRDMFRIHHIGDAEKEQFVEVLEEWVEHLLLVETRFEVRARKERLSPASAARLKERAATGEAPLSGRTKALTPLIEEIGRIEKEVGVSSKEMKEDLVTVLSARKSLQAAKKDAV